MTGFLILTLAVLLAAARPVAAEVPVPRLNTSAHLQPSDYPVLGNFELSGLTPTPDGDLWGVSAYGGANSSGFVYRLTPATGRLVRVHDFNFDDGVHPRGRLLRAADGWLYGTTESGGVNQADWCYAGKFYNAGGCGTLFRVSLDGRFEKLHDFYSGADGYHASPVGGLVQAADGALYGMAVRAFPEARPSLFRFRPGIGLQAMRLFPADQSQGGLARAGLLLARDGSLIGTTGSGGGGGGGCGTVFRATVTGGFQTLHVFTGAPEGGDGDGCSPDAPLVEGAPGVFYGSTPYGGHQADACRAGGCGTVFRTTAAGGHRVLHRFKAQSTDGLYPGKGGLVVMPDGALVGAAAGNPYGDGAGFAPLCQLGGATGFACGTVYRIAPDGGLTVLASFGTGNGAFGLFPMSPLAQGADGNVYGTTFAGGGHGVGTVWRWILNAATPAVAVDSFTPAGGPPGTVVTLQGLGFTGTTQVTLGNGQVAEPVPFNVIDDRTITAQVQAGAQTSAFGVSGPVGTTFSPTSFVLQPVIERITPTSGPAGSSVTLLGAHFDALTSISFGGTPATQFSYVTGDNTAINVQVPRRAKTGPIIVSNVGGSAASTTFRVTRFAGAGTLATPADPAASAPGMVRCLRYPAPGSPASAASAACAQALAAARR